MNKNSMNNNSRLIFAKNLRNYMELNKTSRKELTDLLDVSTSTISQWLSGSKYPRIDKIEKLANYYNINTSDLTEDRMTIKQKVKNKQAEIDNIAQYYNKLNDFGKLEADKRIKELTEMDKYTKTNDTIAAHLDQFSKKQLELINKDLEELEK